MISSSLFSVTILEKVAENAIPISIKFKTGLNITILLKTNPTPDVNKILRIKMIKVSDEFLSFFKVIPAKSPVAAQWPKAESPPEQSYMQAVLLRKDFRLQLLL